MQCSSDLGAVEANRQKLTALVEEAAAAGAKIIVLPETAVTGYLSQDLKTNWRLRGWPMERKAFAHAKDPLRVRRDRPRPVDRPLRRPRQAPRRLRHRPAARTRRPARPAAQPELLQHRLPRLPQRRARRPLPQAHPLAPPRAILGHARRPRRPDLRHRVRPRRPRDLLRHPHDPAEVPAARRSGRCSTPSRGSTTRTRPSGSGTRCRRRWRSSTTTSSAPTGASTGRSRGSATGSRRSSRRTGRWSRRRRACTARRSCTRRFETAREVRSHRRWVFGCMGTYARGVRARRRSAAWRLRSRCARPVCETAKRQVGGASVAHTGFTFTTRPLFAAS